MTKSPYCPECDNGNITRQPNKPTGNNDKRKWLCRVCGHRFDDPTYREPKNDTENHGRSGLSKKLLDMDPEDL